MIEIFDWTVTRHHADGSNLERGLQVGIPRHPASRDDVRKQLVAYHALSERMDVRIPLGRPPQTRGRRWWRQSGLCRSMAVGIALCVSLIAHDTTLMCMSLAGPGLPRGFLCLRLATKPYDWTHT